MQRVALLFALLSVMFRCACASDRPAKYVQLSSEYEAAEQQFFKFPIAADSTDAEKIRRFEAWPGWKFIPRFLELAEAQPDDETAFKCCMWFCDRARNVGNSYQPMFDADQRVWQILGAHHTGRADLPMMCLRAVEYDGPRREQFLRGLVESKDLSRENMGFATVALAEMLAKRFDRSGRAKDDEVAAPRDEIAEYFARKKSPEAVKYLVSANAEQLKTESTKLLNDVLAHYADIPVTITAPGFRSLKNLGEKAANSLHSLECLTIGSVLPNLSGNDLNLKPLDLRDYRGKIVVISVWFTGCNPCMELVSQEQRLLETYRRQPFVLLGVCCDESIEMGRTTANEHRMDWPCWFDGQNGHIARELNVLRFPTIYVLDQNGVIAAKDLRGKQLDVKIAQLMEAK